MSSTPQYRAELLVMMQLRRLSFGHNPLRRRVDRIEAAFLLVAIAVALLVIPAAAALGTTLHDRAEQSAADDRASAQQVHARTLEGTANAVASTLGLSTTPVRVSWRDRSGSSHEGKADVLLGTPVNADVTIWIDQAGAMTGAPGTSADSAALGTAIALTFPLLAWPALYAACRLARRPLDRHRAEEWAREWRKSPPAGPATSPDQLSGGRHKPAVRVVLLRKTSTEEVEMKASQRWQHRAACAAEDPELFFPVGTTGPALQQIETAKQVCRRCEVEDVCLDWALRSGQDAGIWGGLDELERRTLRRSWLRARNSRE